MPAGDCRSYIGCGVVIIGPMFQLELCADFIVSAVNKGWKRRSRSKQSTVASVEQFPNEFLHFSRQRSEVRKIMRVQPLFFRVVRNKICKNNYYQNIRS